MPFRCEARGHHSFCRRPENRPYFWPRWHFSIARPENRPFSWPALSRRSELFGCSSRSLLRSAGWRICQRWCLVLHTRPTLTKNPAILYQGVSIFSHFDGFSAHLDEKTAISLLRCIKATAKKTTVFLAAIGTMPGLRASRQKRSTPTTSGRR